jgi:hypothetical protein
MSKRPKTRPAGHLRAGNPYTTLRAQTIPSKRKVASKRACRGRVVVES